MRWVVMSMLAVACGSPDGTCELPDEGEGTLCYELGPDSNEGYDQEACEADTLKGTWTEGASCETQGFEIVCKDDDGYLVFGETEQTCCAFNDNCG